MKIDAIENDCIEPALGLYVLDWQQGWLDTHRPEDMARKQAVEAHLEQCSACMAGVHLMAELKAVLQQHPELLQEPERYLEPKRAFRIPHGGAVAAMAASLLLGIGLALSWRVDFGWGGRYRAAPETVAWRQWPSDHLAEVRTAYKAGRYTDVVRQLQAPAQAGILSAEGLYYLGRAYADLQEPQSAGAWLAQAVEQSTGALQDDARWALAQSLVSTGQIAAARGHLARLAKSERYGAQAAALAQKLDQQTPNPP